MKICELKIDNMTSVMEIIQALLRTGYSVKSSTIYKEFPREKDIDYFMIEIFDH